MSDRPDVLASLKAQTQGITPGQQSMAFYIDLIAGMAKKRGVRRLMISIAQDGAMCVDYDFEGLGEVT